MNLHKRFPLTAVAILLGIFATSLYAVDHTEPVPIPALGADTYLGQEGGLYPNQSNSPPPDYLINEIQSVYDLLENDSHIVVLCLGMSNLSSTCDNFINKAMQSTDVNPAILFVNAGQPGRAQQVWDDDVAESNGVWEKASTKLEQMGENSNYVDVVIYFNAWGYPEESNFVTYANTMLNSLKITMNNIAVAFPNTQLIYVTSREYGGYAKTNLNPDPWAYQDGFAYKWLVADRINGTIDGPPILWQAYQYDPTWPLSYFNPNDGTHLSEAGLNVAGQLWLDFFLTQPWFMTGEMPIATPTATSTPTTTATPVAPPPFDHNEFLPSIIRQP